MKTLQVLFAPAEYEHLAPGALADTVCVVFDILRATTTIVTALANGAKEVIPASGIPEALAAKKLRPHALLAGERDGVRIHAALTGGIEFDLGNSPREFAPAVVAGKEIIITTTNGSRALNACSSAPVCHASSFLNLSATASKISGLPQQKFILVCSGTGSKSSFEDTLAAGDMVEELAKSGVRFELSDSAEMALQIYQSCSHDLAGAMKFARNGRRLLSMPELAGDVSLCLQKDIYSFTTPYEAGSIRRESELKT